MISAQRGSRRKYRSVVRRWCPKLVRMPVITPRVINKNEKKLVRMPVITPRVKK